MTSAHWRDAGARAQKDFFVGYLDRARGGWSTPGSTS
jgi:hypothetical protein